ncbi:pilus assembly protein [Cupriavidus campinensis]
MRPIALRLALTSWLAIAAMASFQPAMAGDIDLYTGVQRDAGRPNVLIVLDNASTWDADANFTCSIDGVVQTNNAGKDVGAIQCALYKAVASIRKSPTLLGNVNIGLMMFGTGNNVGGKFRFPAAAPYTLPLMDDGTGGGIDRFLAAIQSIDRQADNSNNSQVAGGMQEAWAFFAGKTGLSGTQYTSPIDNPCQHNFVIYIGNAVNNGKPQDTGQAAFDALGKAGASVAQQTEITLLKDAKYQSNWGDEWARFMYQTDVLGNMDNRQNITTYTIAVTDGKNPDYVSLAASMASNGGGKGDVVKLGDVDGLETSLLSVLNEVQAVNSVFASVSLPASVNAQGQFLNQVYVGMFRPDATAAPRWVGNLKQYQVGYDKTGKLVLQDAAGNSAISSASTGFITTGAVSFWTAKTPLSFTASGYGSSGVTDWPSKGYWVNSPSGEGWGQDSPDGEIVEKGGAAEMLRAQLLTSQGNRRLLTCNGAGNCPATGALPVFDTSNTWLTGSQGLAAINAGTTGINTLPATEVPNLIAWVRGQDVAVTASKSLAGREAETGPGSPATVRPSIHADVLHSRPAVVNYGGTTNVVVFYGTNDGVFHAINGNKDQGIGGVRPGGELWGFVAPEFLGKLSRLYTNTPEIKLSTTPDGITPPPQPRDYFFDGSTTVLQDLRDPANPRVILYMTARRGGRLVYAMDVTDPTSPRFLWKKTNAEFGELGQTWSQPRVMRVRGYSKPLIVMGAGYDPAEDSDPSPGVNSMGRGVVAFDAYSGNVVWSALPSCGGVSGTCVEVPDLTRAIPSDVTVVDRNSDGYVERLYVGDVGGNVWRADFETAAGNAQTNWTFTRLATLGGSPDTNDARKFFYAPDVVSTRSYDAVTLGSGDREHPLYSASTTPGTAYNVVNRLYMIKDSNILGMPTTWTPLTEASLVDATAKVYDGTRSGFFITLVNAGEKAVNAPLTVGQYTTVGTNTPRVPKTGMCYPNLGDARSYSFSFLTGAGQNDNRNILLDGGGFPPSSVFGMVGVTDSNGKTTVVPVLLGAGNQTSGAGADDKSGLGAQQVNIAGVGKRKRIYWYSESDKR